MKETDRVFCILTLFIILGVLASIGYNLKKEENKYVRNTNELLEHPEVAKKILKTMLQYMESDNNRDEYTSGAVKSLHKKDGELFQRIIVLSDRIDNLENIARKIESKYNKKAV